MTLPFADLSRIARAVAGTDDTHQEIWLKFLRYPPKTRIYAWRAARSARDSLWRKERTQRHLKALTMDDLKAAGWGAHHDEVEPGTHQWHLLYNRIHSLFLRQALPRRAARRRRDTRMRMRKWRARQAA